MTNLVLGYCPMGCGQTLEYDSSTLYILCRDTNCPNNAVVTKILLDPETNHLVTFDEMGWSAIHPLRERDPTYNLLYCEIGIWAESNRDLESRVYRVKKTPTGWEYEVVE